MDWQLYSFWRPGAESMSFPSPASGGTYIPWLLTTHLSYFCFCCSISFPGSRSSSFSLIRTLMRIWAHLGNPSGSPSPSADPQSCPETSFHHKGDTFRGSRDCEAGISGATMLPTTGSDGRPLREHDFKRWPKRGFQRAPVLSLA